MQTGSPPKPLRLELVERGVAAGRVVHPVGAVDLGGDGLDLLAQRRLGRVEEAERGSAPRRPPPRPRPARSPRARRRRSGSTPHTARPSPRRSRRMASYSLGVVAGEGVDGDHRRDAVQAHVLDLLAQVGRRRPAPRRGSPRAAPGAAACPATIRWSPEWALSARTVATTTAASGVRPDTRHLMLKNRSAPMSAPNPASVIEEVARVDPDPVGDDRGVAVGDVAERPGVDQDRRVLQGLQEVGLEGVTHDHGHRPGAPHVLGGHRRRRAGRSRRRSGPAVRRMSRERGRQREDGHHLGGRVMSNPDWRGTPSSARPAR